MGEMMLGMCFTIVWRKAQGCMTQTENILAWSVLAWDYVCVFVFENVRNEGF